MNSSADREIMLPIQVSYLIRRSIEIDEQIKRLRSKRVRTHGEESELMLLRVEQSENHASIAVIDQFCAQHELY